jgi:heme iron utilization protein
MIDNRKIALLIDSRTNQMSDLKNAIAVTAIGTVEEVDSSKRVNLAKLYIQKHPYLTDFVSNTANALMQIIITDYIVASFDKVQTVHIGTNSSG